jgi:hypothetical protein
LYDLLSQLKALGAGVARLGALTSGTALPERGVYFFFEPGEARSGSGAGPRVVRVGTHALVSGSRSTLRTRLRAHLGNVSGRMPGGGNHRGSVFRDHVGRALIRRDGYPDAVTAQWGQGGTAPAEVRAREYPLERDVSAHLARMPVLWVKIDDAPGPHSLRAYIERNTIALLSSVLGRGQHIDPPSPAWLGRWAVASEIRESGLWHVRHVGETYEPGFLDALQRLVEDMARR